MEINLRRLAAKDPKPVHLPLVQAAALERRGWVTVGSVRSWEAPALNAPCRLTETGREAAEAL